MGCGGSGKKLYFCSGELAEWSIAAVLKTVDLHGSGGSNPSLSANKKAMQKSIAFFRPRKPRPLAVERQKRAKKERHCGAMAFCLPGRPRRRKGYLIPLRRQLAGGSAGLTASGMVVGVIVPGCCRDVILWRLYR